MANTSLPCGSSSSIAASSASNTIANLLNQFIRTNPPPPPLPPPCPPPLTIPAPKSLNTVPCYLASTGPTSHSAYAPVSHTVEQEAVPLLYAPGRGWYIETLPPNPVPIYLPIHEMLDLQPNTFTLTHFKSKSLFVFHFLFEDYFEHMKVTRLTCPNYDVRVALNKKFSFVHSLFDPRLRMVPSTNSQDNILTLATNNLFVAHYVYKQLYVLFNLSPRGDLLPPIVPTHSHPEFTSEMDFKPIPPSELEVEPKPHSKRQKGKKRTAVSDYENMFKTPRHHRNKRDQTHAHYTQPQPIGTTFVNTALTNDDGEMLLSSSNGEPLIVREPVHHTFTGNLAFDIPSFFALFAGKGYVPSQLATVPKALVVDSILAWTQGYGLKDFHTLSHIVRTHPDGPYVVSRKTPDHSHQIRAIRRFLKVMHIRGDFKELAPYFSEIGYNPPQGTFTSEMFHNPVNYLSDKVDSYISTKTSQISKQAATEIKESIQQPGFLEDIGTRIGLSATSSIGSVFKNMLTSTLASLTDMGTQISQFIHSHLSSIIFLIIGSLIGLVGTTLVRMAFTVIFPSKITEFTSEADTTGEELVDWLGRVITSGLVPTFSKTTPFKALTGTIAIFTFFEKAPKFIEFAGNLIKSIIDFSWKFIYNTDDPFFESTANVQKFHKTLEQMMQFVDRDYEKIPLAQKEQFCSNYEQLQLYQSRSVTFKDKDLFIRLSNVINNRRDLYNTVRSNIKIGVIRQEPTSAWLTGDAGLGKTESVDRLFEYLYSLIIRFGKDSPDPVRRRAYDDLADKEWDPSHIGLHSHQDAFFSNYSKNWAFLLDDWRQFGDDTAINSETQIFMLGKATGRFPLPMAELKDKGNNFFVSKVIGVTTNMSEMTLTVPVGYTSFDAFNRRRDFVIHLGGKTNDAAYGSIQQYADSTFKVQRWNHTTKRHELINVGNGTHGFRKLGKLLYERYLYYTEKYMKNTQDFEFGSSTSSSDTDDNDPPPPPDNDTTPTDDPPTYTESLLDFEDISHGLVLQSAHQLLDKCNLQKLDQKTVDTVFDQYYMRRLPLLKKSQEYLHASVHEQIKMIEKFHMNVIRDKQNYLRQRRGEPTSTATPWTPIDTTSPPISEPPNDAPPPLSSPDTLSQVGNSDSPPAFTAPGMSGSYSGKTTLTGSKLHIEQITAARHKLLSSQSLREIPGDVINAVTTSMGYPPVVNFTSEMDNEYPNLVDDNDYDTADDIDDFAYANDPEKVKQSVLGDVAEQAWWAVLTSPVTGPPLLRRLQRTVAMFQPTPNKDIPHTLPLVNATQIHRNITRKAGDEHDFRLLFASYGNMHEVWRAIIAGGAQKRYELPWLVALKAHVSREFRPDCIPPQLLGYPEVKRFRECGEIRHILDTKHDYYAVLAAGGLHIPCAAYAWRHLTDSEKDNYSDWARRQTNPRAYRALTLAPIHITNVTPDHSGNFYDSNRGGISSTTYIASIALHLLICFAVAFLLAKAIICLIQGFVYLLEHFGLKTNSNEYFTSEHSIDIKALQERQRLYKLLKQGNSSAKSQVDIPPDTFTSEQGSSISSIEYRVASNTYISEIEYINHASQKKEMMANVFFLTQNLFALPLHMFTAGPVTKITFYPGVNRRKVNLDTCHWRDVKSLSQLDPSDPKLVEIEKAFERRDLGIFWAPGLRFRKDMTTHLLKRTDLNKLLINRGIERLELGEMSDEVTVKTTASNEPLRVLGFDHDELPLSTDRITVFDYYRLPAMPGGNGLCNSPYISLSNHLGTNFVIGLHVASNLQKVGGSDSIIAPIFREEIDYIVSKIPNDSFNSELDFGEPEFLQLPNFPLQIEDYLGEFIPGMRIQYTVNKRIFFNTQTKLRPTVFQTGTSSLPPPYPQTKAPAALTLEARRLSFRKLEGRNLDCSTRVLDDPKYWEGTFRGLPEDCCRLISLVDCIEGIPSLGIPPCDLTTAAGSPFTQYNVTRKDLIKRDHIVSNVSANVPAWYFEQHDDNLVKPKSTQFPDLQVKGLWVHPDLQYAFYMRHYCSRKGIHCPVLYNMFLKDEDRPIERVELEHTRYVNAAPVDDMLFHKSIFARFIVAIDDNRGASDSKVGLNPYSHEWAELHSYLSVYSEMVVSQDVSGWDIRFPVQMFVPSFLKYFRLYFKLNITSPFYRLVKTATLSHFVVYLVIDNYIVVLIIMPSGGFCTCLFNTTLNSAEHRCVQHIIVDGKDPEVHTFDETNRLGCQGDDSLLAAKFTPEYNGQTIAAIRDIVFNHECTEQDKTPTLKHSIPIKEAVFLQRGFRIENGHVFCPLNPDSLHSCVQWIYKPTDKTFDEQVKINMHFAITEWAQHGKDKFEYHKNLLNKYVGPKQQYYLEYDHVRKKMMGDAYEREIGPNFAARFKTASSFFS